LDAVALACLAADDGAAGAVNVGSGLPFSSSNRTLMKLLSGASGFGSKTANAEPRSIAWTPRASLYEIVSSANGLRPARSNGEFDTRLVRVSPQLVPSPGRAGSGSSARLDGASSRAPPRDALFGVERPAPALDSASKSSPRAAAGGGGAASSAGAEYPLPADGEAGKAFGLELLPMSVLLCPLRASGASLVLQATETTLNARTNPCSTS
jgi:hypothetical protein